MGQRAKVLWVGFRVMTECLFGPMLPRKCLVYKRGTLSGGASEGREGAEPPQIRSKPPQIQSKTLNFLKSGA